ncbi:sugar transferase [Porphyromonas somerae]|uniref:sugar transferase n=1 Tax=Porphyromonas somerae TaxID=322095 RepID=UPI002A75714E|nr:sugar transferase [Porphyromonas somerae]MDY3119840.1 sugar transferase [Porphyromonas somerae]
MLYRDNIKRILDFTLALVMLVLLSPLLIVVYSWLTIANKGAGAIFTQDRPGKNERIFKLYKFKSMTDERDAEGNLLPDAQRLTNVGRFVRKTSLDELPQLWNVLKGDMSFIGPRPLLVRYLPFYTKEERKRHDVRPGITGLSQVNGRNHLPWDDRLEMDVQYVERLSFTLDINIFLKTIKNIISRKDIAVIPGSLGLPLDQERMKS